MAKRTTNYLCGLIILLLSTQLHLSTYAQTAGSATGIVNDENNHALYGVTVQALTGNKIAGKTSSDSLGRFKFAGLKAGDYNFIFSAVGYQSQTVTGYSLKEGQTVSMLIAMVSIAYNLNDVVVVGYGTQKTTDVTGAINTVKVDELLGNRPVSSTSALLQGAVPGMQVTIGSGQPGASTSINLRGATDINTSGNSFNTGGPLILVDNVPFNGGLNLINPADIETITTLKDAGSAAIYGGRSAFGVILITTKQGKKNQKAQFNYDNNITWASATNLPKKATPLQTIQAYNDMGTTSYWTGQNTATWLQLMNDYTANPGKYPNGYTIIGTTRYQLAQTDVIKDMLGSTAPQFTQNFSVNGGSEKTTYRISFGSVNENGVLVPSVHKDYYKRYNAKTFVSSDVAPWLTAQADAGYYYSLQSTPGDASTQFGQAVNLPSYIPLQDTITQTGTSITGVNGTPKNQLKLNYPSTSRYSDVRLTGRAILKPLKGLTITGEYTYENLGQLQKSYSAPISFINSSQYVQQTSGSDKYSVTNSTTLYNAINIYGNYTKKIAKHSITAMLGFNQESNSSEAYAESATGMISSASPSISLATGAITGSDAVTAFTLRGYFGRINYDYDGKYFLQVNGRYDGSSRFPEGHKYGFFPSGSAGWIISKETFMQWAKPALSMLKIRSSYGSVGNQSGSGAYDFLPIMSATNANWIPAGNSYLTTLTTPGLISTDFTWETVQTFDVGTDFGFFNNKLTGTFDWYRRNTNNILAQGAVAYPAVLGTGAPLQNTASITSYGYELQLNWHDKIGKVGYAVGMNLYDSKGKVTSFNGNPNNVLSTYFVGQKMGDIWGYVSDRLYTVNDFQPGSLNANLTGGKLNSGLAPVAGQSPNPGDMKFKDLNGDGKIDGGVNTLANPGDKQIIGNNAPRYQFGFNGSVSYKNFDLSFVIFGILKRDLATTSVLTFPNYYAFGTIYSHELNYWTPTNTNAYYARIYDQAGGNQSANDAVQTRYLLNGAYTQIKNITLAYSVPKNLLTKAHLTRCQLFVSVENPFTFSHLPSGMDPSVAEINYGFGYPFLRRTSLGINLSF